MGLDLVVEGRAKSGHEAEWREILERSFADASLPSDAERFGLITIAPYEGIGAPQVGRDPAADAWIIRARNARTQEEVAQALGEFKGYHVLALLQCDGVPSYSHGGLYEGVDETSFRGAFLSACVDVLGSRLIEEAWQHRFPSEALDYGLRLLEAAQEAESSGPAKGKPSLLMRLGFGKQETSAEPFDEQVKIVRAAGRWFRFWGERGHAIRAWF